MLPADHTSVSCQLKSRFEVDRHAFCRAMHINKLWRFGCECMRRLCMKRSACGNHSGTLEAYESDKIKSNTEAFCGWCARNSKTSSFLQGLVGPASEHESHHGALGVNKMLAFQSAFLYSEMRRTADMRLISRSSTGASGRLSRLLHCSGA